MFSLKTTHAFNEISKTFSIRRNILAALGISLLPISVIGDAMAATTTQQTPLEQIWYSGAGNQKYFIDFSDRFPNVMCGGVVGQSAGNEGTANFTDPVSGQLKLYTDGVKLFNGTTNRVLENGTNMGGNTTAGESAMIVPIHGTNPDLFYIFTNNTSSVYFSIADLSKGPNGTVTLLKQLLASSTGEAIGVVPHANSNDFWVLVFNTAARVDAYKVGASGIARLPVSSNTGVSGAINMASITHSPDYNTLSLGLGASRIATAKTTARMDRATGISSDIKVRATDQVGRIATAKIDRATGIISDIKVRVTGQVGYASAFSPDGTKLYYTNGNICSKGRPWQIDLNTGKSTQLSHTRGFGGPKLATNGKIYWTKYNHGMLSAVDKPNAAGTDAHFSLDALSLNGCTGSINLPNQTASFLNFVKPVDFHITTVEPGQSVEDIDFGNTFYLDTSSHIIYIQVPKVFQVPENKKIVAKPEKTVTLTFSVPEKPSVIADIAFVVDQSHSHKDDLARFQTHAEQIINDFDTFGESVYYALTGFIDYPDPPYGKEGDFPYRLYQTLTDDKERVISKIKKLSTYLGGDNLESQFEAISRTINELKWRTGSLRILFLLTDANFHDSEQKLSSPDEGERDKDSDYLGHGYSKTLSALVDKHITMYGLGGTGRMDDLPKLSEASGGFAYRLSASKEQVAKRICNILKEISEKLTISGYLVLKTDKPRYVESIQPKKIDLARLSAGYKIQFTVTFKPDTLQNLEQVEFSFFLQTNKGVFLEKQPVILKRD
jgi:hypothetical protein